MSKLNKAFKSLKLKRDEANKLEFRKREGLHDFKMRPMIQHFIDDIVGGRKHSDDDDGDASSHSGSESDRSGDSGSDHSDSESSKSESDSGKKKKRKRSISYDVEVPA
jgi:hypothetical protein